MLLLRRWKLLPVREGADSEASSIAARPGVWDAGTCHRPRPSALVRSCGLMSSLGATGTKLQAAAGWGEAGHVKASNSTAARSSTTGTSIQHGGRHVKCQRSMGYFLTAALSSKATHMTMYKVACPLLQLPGLLPGRACGIPAALHHPPVRIPIRAAHKGNTAMLQRHHQVG